MPNIKRWVICLLWLAGISTFAAGPTGGGFLKAGLRGSYFNNPDLSGSPAFSRKDPRIDFYSVSKPGGSNGRGFNEIGTEGYSVRWTGQLQSRFSESYTFTLISDDGARL